MALTERQRTILRGIVEEHVQTGEPVGSRRLVERAGLDVSSSTVRHELAELETLGLLTHPHTSAGRLPTESGYRMYADDLVDRLDPEPDGLTLDVATMRAEVETALQTTTEALSQATRLLALISAPSLGGATLLRVDLVSLQPRLLLVVVITSAGAVSKRTLELEDAVDPGLVSWAQAYLNEQLVGVRLGSAALRRRLEDISLTATERAFVDLLRPALEDVGLEHDTQLYVGGAAALLGEARGEELVACQRLLDVLEHRAAVLELLSDALDPRRAFVRVGPDVEGTSLHDVAYVGSTYGLAHRSLGTVGLLGPLRMDYEKAIRSVRAAALELSRVVGDVYEEA